MRAIGPFRPEAPGAESRSRSVGHGRGGDRATLMLLQGVHPKVVSERLGHASIGITLDNYSTCFPRCNQTSCAPSMSCSPGPLSHEATPRLPLPDPAPETGLLARGKRLDRGAGRLETAPRFAREQVVHLGEEVMVGSLFDVAGDFLAPAG